MKMKIKRILLVLFLVTVFASCTQPERSFSAVELLNLGERYLLELNFEQALVQFMGVIEIEPMKPRGYTGAAEAHIGLGQLDEAVAILQLGLERTGDVEIKDMFDELLYQLLYALLYGVTASEQSSSGTDTDNGDYAMSAYGSETNIASVQETINAPFTAEKIALLDRIIEEMLLGNYEGAAVLIASEIETLHSITEAHAFHSFIYRDMFHFAPFNHIGGSHFGAELHMNTVYAGVGSIVRIQVRVSGGDYAQWSGVIEVIPFSDGRPNGLLERHSFSEGMLRITDVMPVVDGNYHGEYVSTLFLSPGRSSVTTEIWEYGYKQPLGLPNEFGQIPARRIVDGQQERFSYELPELLGNHNSFDVILSHHNVVVERWGGHFPRFR